MRLSAGSRYHLTALRCRNLAVEGHRCLEDDEGQPVVTCFTYASLSSAHHPLGPLDYYDTFAPQLTDALAKTLGFGSRMATTTVRMPALTIALVSERRLSVAAWFERDVER